MITRSAVDYIKNELKFEAKKHFYDKYNATDGTIDVDGFTYTKDAKVVVHPYKAVSEAYIIKTLHDEMVNVAMNSIPLGLLERIGGGVSSMLRVIDKYWMIRIPAYPSINDSMDIDDGLTQVVVYRSLASIGINKFIQVAKEMMDAYNKGISIPDPFEAVSSVNFRFSSDGAAWHESYTVGDTYMAFSKDGVWGNAIPIGGSGGGVDEVGAKKFTELSDAPATLVANKLLAVNATGNAIVLVDAPTSSGGAGVEHEGRVDFTLTTVDNIVDLSGDKRTIVINVSENVEIDFVKSGLDYAVADGARYTLVVYPSGYTVAFNNNIIFNGLSPINSTALCVTIDVMSLDFQFYAIGQKEF